MSIDEQDTDYLEERAQQRAIRLAVRTTEVRNTKILTLKDLSYGIKEQLEKLTEGGRNE